ncbi:hypothetical protein BD289DRAFT_371979 [Coniella lustricola]|uniref:Thioredoxin-like protein n=1 Tax=Coniella lustricola TaxID=2025994 RepID=A0A2T3A302_9PEZI|nr:hypothetical protein BD289DRAFT_371979 [Coniella lustricola]
MTVTQELSSWLSPPQINTASPPATGHHAPSTRQLEMPVPGHQPAVVTFLRHCGCPFAEKTYLGLRDAAAAHPAMAFYAVSHSTQPHTDKWLSAIGGPTPANLRVIVDDRRELYAAWGLGTSSFWHVLNPADLWRAVRLARDQGITNRPTESGYRFQTSGSWAVDGRGTVVWGAAAASASVIPDFEEAVRAVDRQGEEWSDVRAEEEEE